MPKKRNDILEPTSVYQTQESVMRLEQEIRDEKLLLNRLQDRLEKAREQHRHQIRLSLESAVLEEREAAERIAPYWEVDVPAGSPVISPSNK